MPIINRPASKARTANPTFAPTPDASSVPDILITPASSPTRSNESGLLPWAILALIFGITLPFGGYFGYIKIKENTSIANEDLISDIDYNIRRYEKVSTMASLAREIYESNFVALQEAEKVANTTTYTALEVVVNKKRQELAQYKDQIIDILFALSEISAKNPEPVANHLQEAILLAEQKDSTESVRLLQLAEKVIRGSPLEGDRIGYLREAINDHL